MGGSGKSTRAEQRELVAAWRADGRTYVEIAEAIRHRYGVNARVALRLARGWSQSDAAAEWNARWPESPKTFKNISYWERWPSRTGYAPSLTVLERLAQLYQCSLGDLLAGSGNFRQEDEHYGRQPHRTAPTSNESTPASQLDLAGIWHSHYAYRSNSRGGGTRMGEHYVVLSQDRREIRVASLPHSIGSQLEMELSVNGPIATGTWIEHTSPDGNNGGASYHGVVQMVVDPTGRHLEGKWLGFDAKFHIRAGPWTLRWIEGSTDIDIQQKYHYQI